MLYNYNKTVVDLLKFIRNKFVLIELNDDLGTKWTQGHNLSLVCV